MPVSNFECQIARGQIGRYLDGGMLSPQAMAGLEEHLDECPGCKALVAERRAALMGALGGEMPARAVVEMPAESPRVAGLRAKSVEEPEPVKAAPAKAAPRYAKSEGAKGALGKPMALAALLAVVLVGMSRISRTATSLASRADASFAAQELPPSAPKAEPKPVEAKRPAVKPVEKTPAPAPRPAARVDTPTESNPDAGESTPTAPTAMAPVHMAPVPDPMPRTAARPKPVTRPRAAKRPARKRAGHRGRRRPLSKRTGATPSVRVYGLDGRPLKP